MKRVIWDLDDTIAPLVPTWIEYYNFLYSDNLTANDIKGWDIAKYVKPECGNLVYDIIRAPGFFSILPVAEGAIEAIQELSKTMDNYFCTNASECAEIVKGKYEWIENHFPNIGVMKTWVGSNKGMMNADYMIDDKPENLMDFERSNPNGIGILMDANHNKDFGHEFIRVMNPMQAVQVIKDFELGNLIKISSENEDFYFYNETSAIRKDNKYGNWKDIARVNERYLYLYDTGEIIKNVLQEVVTI